MTDGSRKAIIAALYANLGIALAKFVGCLLTSSAGLLAEAASSLIYVEPDVHRAASTG